ncbi:MAG: oxidoreductase [Bauldia sp.]|nr:oxidoreductase [Bauldia sp.]
MDESQEPPRLRWQEATVERIVAQTPTVKSFFLRPAEPFDFIAGQHVDLRLTAPDGYQAQRSYSIGSTPGDATIELVIERLEVGEVSLFFHDVAQVGDAIEIRGPIGGHFNWRPIDGGPILLIGGGSGVVPLLSILRARRAAGSRTPMVLVYSARSLAEVIYRDELMHAAEHEDDFSMILTLTRETGPVTGARLGRIMRETIAEALEMLGEPPRLAFICGATAFVEVAAMFLIEAGVPPVRVRTERYGGSPAVALDASITLAPEA